MYRTPMTAKALELQRMIRRGNSPSGRIIIETDLIIIELEPGPFDEYATALGTNGAEVKVATLPNGQSHMEVGRISFMTPGKR